MKYANTITLGDVEVCYSGDYGQPDSSCGYSGDFTLEVVILPSDEDGVNLITLLSDEQIERIENEAMNKANEHFANHKLWRGV